ncbi:hypothetical protein Mgra_00006370 [Meloidogyne graminicola]|uniref:Uncharacterized protein n=1 Tax=Meloidogyne graminicola TaxID=189291 RepID=A0A8S9ZLS4_9BILA|nr:hypothetical protein Mgra_00006370 [Meloidogyne graminicola]
MVQETNCQQILNSFNQQTTQDNRDYYFNLSNRFKINGLTYKMEINENENKQLALINSIKYNYKLLNKYILVLANDPPQLPSEQEIHQSINPQSRSLQTRNLLKGKQQIGEQSPQKREKNTKQKTINNDHLNSEIDLELKL